MARQAKLRSGRSTRNRKRSAWICALAATAFALGTPGVAAAHDRGGKRRAAYDHTADHYDRHHDHSRYHIGPHQRGRRSGHYVRDSYYRYRDARGYGHSKHTASHRYYCRACRHDFRSHHALGSHVRYHHHVPKQRLFDRIAYRVGFGYVYGH